MRLTKKTVNTFRAMARREDELAANGWGEFSRLHFLRQEWPGLRGRTWDRYEAWKQSISSDHQEVGIVCDL